MFFKASYTITNKDTGDVEPQSREIEADKMLEALQVANSIKDRYNAQHKVLFMELVEIKNEIE